MNVRFKKESLMGSISLLILILLSIISCENDNDSAKIKKDKITGVVQKGPFINGTQMIMSELTSSLDQTGNIFTTQITNDLGTFEIENIELSSSFVDFSSNGYYFNEVEGKLSSSQLTLYALSDITNRVTININIMTHLEKRRVTYLLKEKKQSFQDAKNTAQKEILAIFGIEYNDMQNSETLDINYINESNAIMLAISIILQANNNVGELTELLAKISNDIYLDGVQNDEVTINKLREKTLELNLEQIRTNLETRYKKNGQTANVPNFEKYIYKFLAHTALKPTVFANAVSVFTTTQAVLTGYVNPNSASTDIVYEYGKTMDFGNLAKFSQSPVNGALGLPISIEINGLEPGTTYFYRIKATNEKGITFSDIKTFKTLGSIPIIKSINAIDVKLESARFTGKVRANYSSTEVFFEYGKSTAYENFIKAEQSPIDGNAEIEINVNVNNLEPATTYYLRIKAVNQFGISYSDNYILKTEITGKTGTVQDIDGNIYKTIGIGHQMWMAENLRTTTYNDGLPISYKPNLDEWKIEGNPSYCWYENDSLAFSNVYGAMYNYFTVLTNKLCPSGWHVPNDVEWETLIDYVGGKDVAGGYLKEIGNSHWVSPNTGATDAYGFTALPGGYRRGAHGEPGDFKLLGEYCFWWSTGSTDNYMPYKFSLVYNSKNFSRGIGGNGSGHSVRCIKD